MTAPLDTLPLADLLTLRAAVETRLAVMDARCCAEPGCSARLSRGNASGLCRPHNMRALHADPTFAAANAERSAERMRALNADPTFAARLALARQDAPIRREQSFMAGLDDEAVVVFADSRDARMTCAAAREIAIMDMEERGVALRQDAAE